MLGDCCAIDPERVGLGPPGGEAERLVERHRSLSLRETRDKQRHRASIWGVYVSPAHRGRGFGRSVVAACIDHARTWPNIEWVALGVSAGIELRGITAGHDSTL